MDQPNKTTPVELASTRLEEEITETIELVDALILRLTCVMKEPEPAKPNPTPTMPEQAQPQQASEMTVMLHNRAHEVARVNEDLRSIFRRLEI